MFIHLLPKLEERAVSAFDAVVSTTTLPVIVSSFTLRTCCKDTPYFINHYAKVKKYNTLPYFTHEINSVHLAHKRIFFYCPTTYRLE